MNTTERSRLFWLRIKAAVASLYFASMFFVLGPAAILSLTRSENPFATTGLLGVAIGTIVVIAANLLVAKLVAAFIREGDGTHVPIDPPRRFVSSLAYQYARNPMYLAYMATAVGEAVLFGSLHLLAYAAGFWLIAHLYVVLREEPLLERRFGEDYREYCARVPRWGMSAAPIAALKLFAAETDPATPES